MTDEQKTEKIIEHGERIAKLESDRNELINRVKMLEHEGEIHGRTIAEVEAQNREQFNRLCVLEDQSKEIKSLAQNTNEIALSLRTIDGKVDEVEGRVVEIEEDRKQKSHAVWQVIVSALLGGGLTYAVTQLIGG